LRQITETRVYLHDFNAGKRSSRKQERLRVLWREASHRIEEFDPHLAKDLMFKEMYWADPNDAGMKRKARKLEDLLQDLMNLIGPDSKTLSDSEITTLGLNS
jgi:hypothetical protein